MKSTEVLILRLSQLLDQHDELLSAYHQLYGDWRAAEAKIALLESQLTALLSEHNDTPEKKRSPIIIAAIATAVIAALGGIANTAVSETIKKPAEKVVEAGAKVQADCNITITDNRPGTAAGTTGSSGIAKDTPPAP